MAVGPRAVPEDPPSTLPPRITQSSALTNEVKTLPLAAQLGGLLIRADDPNKDFLVGQWRDRCQREGAPFIVAVVEGDRAHIEINGKQSRVAPTKGIDITLLDIHLEIF